ncbi:unnamed protein product [Tilletia controversa]|uniref:Manganese/iron superoxide dismutase C-terminal domain-containing protein n=1 Tax=Tilletia caries TaxID=13290 RepID=A0A177U7I6_9BASI|nr:hypothetical protein CF336_g5852 [Tilletia laevis]KAE8194731.1 hypothetical protein CF335_g5269 [Tilletia laevis]KAE8256985.1 hypothetical protein A4X03_0g4859 [Tilletia caries]CAD6935899.1 unnamed protein product [Tilletia controversa]
MSSLTRTASSLRTSAARAVAGSSAAAASSFAAEGSTTHARSLTASALRQQHQQPLHTAALRRPAPSSTSTSTGTRRGERTLHTLPPIPARFGEEEACAPFLSSKAFQTVAREYQAGLLDRLNDEVRGTEWEMSSIAETVMALAQKRSQVLAFNYASQAMNNSFFINGLMPKNTDGPSPKPELEHSVYPGQRTFQQALYASYQSLPALKSAFSAAAMGMASSGWVWLVRDGHGKLGVVGTYGAGTLLLQSREQRGGGGANASWVVDPSAEVVLQTGGAGEVNGGGVSPAAGQSVSAVQRDNVGATMGGGVNASSTAPAAAIGEKTSAGGGSSKDSANKVVPPAAGSSVSPAAKGNPGGTVGGGVGVRSFSTSSGALAGSNSGRGGGGGGGLVDDLAGTLGKFVSQSSSFSAASTNQGGYGAASPNGQGFRRSTITRRSLDEYESDAGAMLFPLLCVSVHEHAWLGDYGLWGKEEYLRQYWECVDWKVVEHLYNVYE